MDAPAPFPRTPAMTAGISILLMSVVAPMGLMPLLALRGLSGAALTKAAAAGLPGFGWVVLAWVAVVVLDIFAACALYLVYRGGAEAPSQLAAWFRLAYAAILGSLVAGLADVAAMGRAREAHLAPAIRAGLDHFHEGFALALIVFSMHLLVLAGAIRMSKRSPGWVAALVGIAGLGYLVDGVAHQLGMTLDLSLFTFVGEPVLAVTLLWQALSSTRR